MKTFAAIAGLALAVMATPAFAEMPGFAASCPGDVKVESDGEGGLSINGERASVDKIRKGVWQAHAGNITLDIGRDGAQMFVSRAPNGDVCEVTASSAKGNSDGSIGGVSMKDQKACLAAVTRQTNNADVKVLTAVSSEANNDVTVGVGPQSAKWQCLVKEGNVAGVMSLTNEGAQ
jgi:hypothetical protein